MSFDFSLPDMVRKYFVLIGCVLLIMPVSVSVYFGNFYIYISSYYYINASKVTVWIDPLWLSSAFKILQPIGMVLAGFVEKRTKNLNTGIALGAFLQSSSVVLSYWAIAEPLALLMTFGILQGIAGGILLALPYKKVSQVFCEKRGLAIGILSTGPGGFSLLHMVLSYYLINPDNKSTDVEIGNMRYFTDADLINRVPSFFFKIGLFTTALQLIGFLLILLQRHDLSKENSQSTVLLVKSGSADDCEKNDSKTVSNENCCELTKSNSCVNEKKTEYLVTCEKSTHSIEMDKSKESDCSQAGNGAIVEREKSSDEEVDEPKDFTTKEMLMSCSFWKTWLIFALLGHTFFIHLNLYKQFGLTVINDDNLLVMAGSISSFVLMLFRPVVGIMSDKFGMKPILVITCACANVFMTMMKISLYTFPPMYIAFVGLEFYAVSAVKVFYYMAPMIMFGPTHFATNVGLMSSSQWITFFVGPVIAPALIKSVGWAYVMMSGAAAAAVAFFLAVSLPET
ncbi:agnestins efflux protein AgnL12 [Biomphalaria pfeifferi]|uniref:Agnestins efflux protein AgnL12 n=1 Tax=Biomphalaria pfeifferi TaxID=112525 RepID=A0AAD8BH03_BIOPF|nr:agnestins efflux protein AgnL12 [Biomphalaria pfeifferi]